MNGAPPSITNVDDAKVTALIARAKVRVLLLTPGVSEPVANALCGAWKRLGSERVNVILDVDPEVCRLGYGTMEGLNALRDAAAQAQTLVCHQPGIRISLLITDDATLIYSPTPLLIEAGSIQPERPNGIALQSPPAEVARDVGLGEGGAKERIVGMDPVKPQQIEEVQRDLANAPPVKFDLARRVRVFTSRFQFVELEMTGCFVSRKRVPIPSSLVGLARNQAVQSQFHAHFNLVNSARLEVKLDKRVLTEESLAKHKQQIIKDFLIPLKGYGSVVLRGNKDRLSSDVEALKADVKQFQEGIKKDLQKHMDDNAAALVEALFPAIKGNPPSSYTKVLGGSISDAQLRKRLEDDIKDAFGAAGDLVQEMKVSLVFKDVAYESLVDKKFLEIARDAMPGLEFLHEEFDAASPIKQEAHA